MTHDDQSPVFFHPEDDPALLAAAEHARASFGSFWRELSWEQRRIVKGLDVACIKLAFADPPVPEGEEQPPVEQMWVQDVDFDGHLLHGILVNSPNWLTSVEQGDQIQAPLNWLNDWLYAMDGQAFGGFSVNAMRAAMDPDERAQHDEAWGLEYGDPAQTRLVPERFFPDVPDAAKIVCDLKTVQAHEHPMALNMLESLEQFVVENLAQLNTTDDLGRTMLHQLALAGTTAGVDVLLRHGVDRDARTENGMTAQDLAASLGWSDVVARLQANG